MLNVFQQLVLSVLAGGIVHMITSIVVDQAEVLVLVIASGFAYLILEVVKQRRRAREAEAKRASKVAKPQYGPKNPMLYKACMMEVLDSRDVVVGEVEVRPARAAERRRWDALVDEHHYLGFRQFAGRGVATSRSGAATGWRSSAGSRARSSARRGTAGWAGTGRCSSGVCT